MESTPLAICRHATKICLSSWQSSNLHQNAITKYFCYSYDMSKEFENRLEAIENRNSQIEGDKGWDTSWARRISIMVLTCAVVAFYLQFVIHINPWINALVPVIGFLLLTLTLSLLKKRWLSNRKGGK